MQYDRNDIFTVHISPYVTVQGTDDDLVRFFNRRTGDVAYTKDPDRFLDNRCPFDWRQDQRELGL